MSRLVEIRSYALTSGTWPTLARLFREAALPLLDAAGIDVVAFGQSPVDADSAFLIRSFADAADRERREDAFYASDAWRQGPREAILACIDIYTDTLLVLDEAAIEGLRRVGIADA